MRKLFILSLLTAAAIVPASAASISFALTFTVSGSFFPSTPAGSFDYDAGSGFANFIVTWGNATFDFTTSANNPVLASPDSTGCDPAATGTNTAFSSSPML